MGSSVRNRVDHRHILGAFRTRARDVGHAAACFHCFFSRAFPVPRLAVEFPWEIEGLAAHEGSKSRRLYFESGTRAARPGARKGNERAFTELVRRNWRMIYRISRRVLKNHEDAEDNLQNVLVKVYQRLDGFQESSRFSSAISRDIQ